MGVVARSCVWLVIICAWGVAHAQSTTSRSVADQSTLVAESPSIDVRDGEVLWKGQWTLNRPGEPQVLTINLKQGETKEVCFLSGARSLCRNVADGRRHDFVVVYAGQAYPHRIIGRFVPRANFSAAYIRANRGTEQFLIPESYELANIIISLTPYGRQNANRIFQGSRYYEQVQAHFGNFAGHPLVAQLSLDDESDFQRFMGFRENAAYWRFQGDDLHRPGPYVHHWDDPDRDLFEPNVALVEDFARKSGFRKFYAAHRPYYGRLIAHFEKAAPLNAMVDWLETNFARDLRYDSYKVIFSPLVAFSHSAFRGETSQYREALMFVGAPHIFGSGELANAKTARMIFTEVDHNFVNPVSERHRAAIADAMTPLCFWNDVSISGGYSDPQQTFNEYMTWATFTLWARDRYPGDEFGRIVKLNRYDMIERGFREFPAFDRSVLSAYRSAAAGQKVAHLYPMIISSAAAHQRTSAMRYRC